MTKDEFHLHKVSFNGVGLTAEYETTQDLPDGTRNVIENKVSDQRDVHPDLRHWVEVFGRLASIVIREWEAFGIPLQGIYEIPSNPASINSVVLCEDGGVIIAGVLPSEIGDIKFKTPKLHPENTKLADLTTIIKDAYSGLFDEVFAYLFEGKQAQLSLFGEVAGE